MKPGGVRDPIFWEHTWHPFGGLIIAERILEDVPWSLHSQIGLWPAANAKLHVGNQPFSTQVEPKGQFQNQDT